MPQERFSQFFRRWLLRMGRPKPPRSVRRRPVRPNLGLEMFEERLVPSTLPAPTVAASRTIMTSPAVGKPPATLGGFSPSAAANPLNPLQIVLADTTGTTVTATVSNDGGNTWTTIFQSTPAGAERLLDPIPVPASQPRVAFTNAYNPTVAFSRDGFVYLSYLQTNANVTNGAVVVNKINVANANAPLGVMNINDSASPYNSFATTGFDGKLIYEWTNGQDPAYNPTIAIDDNLPNFTDADGTQYTDSMSGKAVYVAWNSNATAPNLALSELGNGLNAKINGGVYVWNPATIHVAASGDEGGNFTNPMPVDDWGYVVPLKPFLPAAYKNLPFVPYGATGPQILFSPGASTAAGGQGHLVFAWQSTTSGVLSVENSQPDAGNLTLPAAGRRRSPGA